MVTENDRRWPVGLHGTPGRFGKLIEYHLFDAPFFSVHGKQASVGCCSLIVHHAECKPKALPPSCVTICLALDGVVKGKRLHSKATGIVDQVSGCLDMLMLDMLLIVVCTTVTHSKDALEGFLFGMMHARGGA